MHDQRPPAPFSATYSHQSPQPSPYTTPDSYDFQHNEKDAYTHHYRSSRPDRHSRSSHVHAHDSVISPFSPKDSSPPSPSSSVSSAGRKHHSIADSRNSRSGVDRHSIQRPPKAHLDPEKYGYDSSRGGRSPHRVSGSGPDAEAVVYDQGKYQEKGPEDKAWQLLFFLSGPCALLSGAITIWTVFAVLVALLLAPLGFCSSRPCVSEQLKKFLAPALNLQLHLVYSHDSKTGYSAPMLVVIHLFSPIIALGVAIAAWTAAGFWFFSSILGDPGGHDGHNDGKESIVGVRNWWERWLCRGLRESSA
ncbi:hypothetical protein ACN47E_007778 [Coniothyrium glycines]